MNQPKRKQTGKSGSKPESKKATWVNGVLVLRRRKELDLSQLQLATNANVSDKTIRKMEDEHQASPASIHLVAEALGLSYEQLTQKGEAPKVSKKVSSFAVDTYDDGRRKVIVDCDLEASGDIKRQAIRWLTEMLADADAKNGFEPERMIVKRGSLKITTWLTVADEVRLTMAYASGKLKRFRITSITVDLHGGIKRRISVKQLGETRRTTKKRRTDKNPSSSETKG